MGTREVDVGLDMSHLKLALTILRAQVSARRTAFDDREFHLAKSAVASILMFLNANNFPKMNAHPLTVKESAIEWTAVPTAC